jgi:hypothetical protein
LTEAISLDSADEGLDGCTEGMLALNDVRTKAMEELQGMSDLHRLPVLAAVSASLQQSLVACANSSNKAD